LAMEWLKNHWVLAKSGDAAARRKLLILAVGVVVSLALLISGQTESKPIEIQPKDAQSESIQSQQGYVHISGAIANPGVYPITPGMRLFEVIAIAGGFSSKADQSSVNLARVVTDGEQILIASGGVTQKSDGLVSLNRASSSDLDKLPGIGPTLAARIIDWREANNGFQAIEDLRKVGGIGDKLFAGLKKLVKL
jgi:competence protein ComEA